MFPFLYIYQSVYTMINKTNTTNWMVFKCYKNNFKYLYTYLVFVGIDAMVVVALGFEWLDLILLHKNVKIKLQQMQEILRQ